MTFMPGPDFPTGAIIQGRSEIKKAYETGKGRIAVRSKVEVEKLKGGREQLVVTEIPYEINKATLVKRIDDVRVNAKVPGISEVRDESDREGLRIAIELKKKPIVSWCLTTSIKTQICKLIIISIWWQLTI